jgi:glycosyltransferase involved in cell wall biosynthesis
VLSVGLPVLAKGHDLVVKALAQIPEGERPALRLVLPRVDGTASITKLAKDLKVEVTVDISVEEEQFVECYQRSLLTVCAARLEPFGLTPIESMACGTPVVAFREAGFRESVIEGRTGFLVEPTIDSLAAGIRKLAGDPDLIERMGRQGSEEVARNWTWTRTGDQMEEILEIASRAR